MINKPYCAVMLICCSNVCDCPNYLKGVYKNRHTCPQNKVSLVNIGKKHVTSLGAYRLRDIDVTVVTVNLFMF